MGLGRHDRKARGLTDQGKGEPLPMVAVAIRGVEQAFEAFGHGVLFRRERERELVTCLRER